MLFEHQADAILHAKIKAWVHPGLGYVLHFPITRGILERDEFADEMVKVVHQYEHHEQMALHAALTVALADPIQTPDRLSAAIRRHDRHTGGKTIMRVASNVVLLARSS